MTQIYKTTAIVIGVVDYKEKDKLVTLFSLELGLLTASLKGVKSNSAKLKYAGQPFCFGEFELVRNGTKFTILSVSIIDQFYDLTTDYDHFMEASLMVKMLPTILKDDSVADSLFLTTIKLLKVLTYEKVDGRLVLIKFMLSAFTYSGYRLNFEGCSDCGKPFTHDKYLDINLGNFVCSRCAGVTSKLLPQDVFTTLGQVEECEEENIPQLESNNLTNALNVLITTFYYIYGVKLTDLIEYLNK